MKKNHDVVREFIFLGLTFFSVALFWQYDLLIFFILISIYIIRSFFWHKPKDHVLFAISILLGFIMEFVFTYAGLYQFSSPSLFNMPFWIPLS